ncbi:four helix bundle protein [Patescibacteria group bacterium]|nr:four helix bundle protein [Patescibacteria group bacterium]
MSRYIHLPIFQKGYDLNLEVYRATHNFPREYKYSLGQKLKETASELLDWIIITNSKEDKGIYFPEINARIERLRIHLRVAYDLKIINVKKLEFLNRFLEEISKQVSGWEKWFFDNLKREIQ